MTEKTVSLTDLRRQRGDLQAKLTRLDQLIAWIEEFGGEARSAPAIASHRKYPYRGKTMLAAVRKCLEMHGNEPMTAKELTEELKEGGYKSKAADPQRALYSTLYKNFKDKGEVESKNGKWSINEPRSLPKSFLRPNPKAGELG